MSSCNHIQIEEVKLALLDGGEQVKIFARCKVCGSWFEQTRTLGQCTANWKMVERGR